MRVVVVGAGYAGTIAANTVARKLPDAQVTVVNPRPDFVERVRLHQQLARTGEAAAPLSKMLREQIETVAGEATVIEDGAVRLGDGTSLPFDAMFLAVGSSVTPMPGTIPVGTWEGAEAARAALADLTDGATVSVIGGGLTGIETAAELAEARPLLRVRLIGPELGASLSDQGRRRVREGLERLGVEVIEAAATKVQAPSEGRLGSVVLLGGEELASDLTLWAILGGTPELAARSGLAVNDEGRAVVDDYLRSVDDPRIFVIGDCAAVPGARLCCAAATPQGAHAARTLVRQLRGRKLKAYSMGYVGQAVSIGRKDAVLQMVRRDDTPRRVHIAGRVAAWSKEAACRWATFGARTTVYAWAPGPR